MKTKLLLYLILLLGLNSYSQIINVSTGIDSSENPLTTGTTDPFWQIVSSPYPSAVSAKATNSFPGAWEPTPVSGTNAKWINTSGAFSDYAGAYTFERTLNVPSGTSNLNCDLSVAYDDVFISLELVKPDLTTIPLTVVPTTSYHLSIPITYSTLSPMAGTWTIRAVMSITSNGFPTSNIGGFLLSGTISLNCQTLYVDADNDGYDNGTLIDCSGTVPTGYSLTTLGTDCDDTNPANVFSLPANLQSGLLANYPFSGGSINDFSGNGHHLTNTNGAVDTTDRNGNPKCAFEFDNLPSSNNQFLSTTNTAFLNGLTEYSISCWYKAKDPTRGIVDYEILVGRDYTPFACPDRVGQWALALYDCRFAVFARENSAWQSAGVCNEVEVWHHLTATYNQVGNTLKLYKNGVLQDTETGVANCGTAGVAPALDLGDLFLGKDFTGVLDDVFIHNREITATEVTQLYGLGSSCCSTETILACNAVSDDFSDSSLWVHPLTTYTCSTDYADLDISGGTFNFTNANGNHFNYMYRTGLIISDTNWKANIDFTPTAFGPSNGVGHNLLSLNSGIKSFFFDDTLSCFGGTTNPCLYPGVAPCTLSAQKGIALLYQSDSPFGPSSYSFEVRINDGLGTITSVASIITGDISGTGTYYPSLERTSATTGILNVYTDAARTIHLSGSPVSFAIPASITGLNTAQIGVIEGGFKPRELTGTLDNLCFTNTTGNPCVTLYVDSDNDGYDNGSIIDCSGTIPTGYSLTTLGTDCDDTNALVNPAATEICYDAIDNNCDGTIDEGCVPIATQVRPSQCGSNLSTINQNIIATPLFHTGIQYRFRVTKMIGSVPSTNPLDIEVLPRGSNNNFNITQLNSYAYDTTYQVEVSVLYMGIWQPYGPACTVKTPVRLTKVQLSQCGITIATMGTVIYADLVPYIASSFPSYYFKITNPITMASATLPRALKEFRMNDTGLSSIPILYATTYNVQVAYRNVDGTISAFGPMCTITTPAFPTTQIQSSQCGFTASSTSQSIFATAIPSSIALPSMYRFRLTNTLLSYSQDEDNTFNSFKLNEFTGLATNTTYNVQVSVQINGVFGPFGPMCTVTTPAVLKEIETYSVDSFSAVVFPNPTIDSFLLEITSVSKEPIELKVYDMIGRQIETRTISFDAVSSTYIGSNYPTGVYNIIITQGEHLKMVKVIKR